MFSPFPDSGRGGRSGATNNNNNAMYVTAAGGLTNNNVNNNTYGVRPDFCFCQKALAGAFAACKKNEKGQCPALAFLASSEYMACYPQTVAKCFGSKRARFGLSSFSRKIITGVLLEAVFAVPLIWRVGRSGATNNNNNAMYVTAAGGLTNNNVNNSNGVRPDFCFCQKALASALAACKRNEKEQSPALAFLASSEYMACCPQTVAKCFGSKRALFDGRKMKTLEEIFTMQNLLAAHRQCRKCKQHKREVIVYELNLFENLKRLQKSILDRSYQIHHYRSFNVYEPKKRRIESLPYKHRIVQRCLCDHVLRDTVEPHLIYDNGACRINKGTDFARGRLKKFMNAFYLKHGAKGYVLKCDVAKFFPSINHEKLKEKLAKIFPEDIYWLLCVFVDSNKKTCGLPIGNQTSQWFALLLLNDIDHFIKETLGIKFYVRYMDDLVLIHESKNYLRECLVQIQEKVHQLELSFNSKTKISQLSEGIAFLGFKFLFDKAGHLMVALNNQTKKRLRRGASKMYQKYVLGLYSVQDAVNNLYGYKMYLSRCKGHDFFNTMKL